MDIETKTNIIIIVILFFIILFLCFLASLILYHIIKFILKRIKKNNKFLTDKWIKKYLFIFSIIISIYQAYTAVYPTDEFYFDEFEYVTNQKIPNSAKIISKKSSYPDFHGDYFSDSKIELSSRDFNELLKKLRNDKTLIESKGYKNEELTVFEKKINGQSGSFLLIHFLRDGKTIIVNVEFT